MSVVQQSVARRRSGGANDDEEVEVPPSYGDIDMIDTPAAPAPVAAAAARPAGTMRPYPLFMYAAELLLVVAFISACVRASDLEMVNMDYYNTTGDKFGRFTCSYWSCLLHSPVISATDPGDVEWRAFSLTVTDACFLMTGTDRQRCFEVIPEQKALLGASILAAIVSFFPFAFAWNVRQDYQKQPQKSVNRGYTFLMIALACGALVVGVTALAMSSMWDIFNATTFDFTTSKFVSAAKNEEEFRQQYFGTRAIVNNSYATGFIAAIVATASIAVGGFIASYYILRELPKAISHNVYANAMGVSNAPRRRRQRVNA